MSIQVTYGDQVRIAANHLTDNPSEALLQELDTVMKLSKERHFGDFVVKGFEDTLVVLPNLESGPCTFNQCEKEAAQKCSRCKIALYCSKECQSTDWKRHKVECMTPSTAL